MTTFGDIIGKYSTWILADKEMKSVSYDVTLQIFSDTTVIYTTPPNIDGTLYGVVQKHVIKGKTFFVLKLKKLGDKKFSKMLILLKKDEHVLHMVNTKGEVIYNFIRASLKIEEHEKSRKIEEEIQKKRNKRLI
jgi:hypothetical protein